VGKLAVRGLPLRDDGNVLVAAALAWIQENASQPDGNPVDSQAPSLTEAKVRLILAQAARAEIELGKARGDVIPLETARQTVRVFARLHRDAMLNFANRYGPAIAGVVSVPASILVAEIDARMRDALNEALEVPMPFEADR
jgi:hypothetical protein